MACGIGFIQWLSESGKLPAAGRVFDLGAARLLGATADELRELLTRHGSSFLRGEMDLACAGMAKRSDPGPPPHRFELPLADVFASTRVQYTSLESVRVAWSNARFDPNTHALPDDLRGTADLVVNFGTSAGIWNQHNAFQALHDACKVGGWMFHQVPGTGHLGVGMYLYQPVLFAELAKENGYEVPELWYSGPLSAGSVLDLAPTFPGVAEGNRLCNDVEGFRANPVPNAVLNVLVRKTADAPFRLPRPGYPEPPPAPPSLMYRAARKAYRKIVGPKKPA